MSIRIFSAFVLLLCSVSFQVNSQEDSFQLLDKSFAKQILKQCSRSAPVYEGEWTPSNLQVLELEKNLPKLKALMSTVCCKWKPSIYVRQYVGIISNGKKLIYINAILASSFKAEVGLATPLIRCDGGMSAWGAVYDPQTKLFGELAYNGRGLNLCY